jgi:hypothetical protein
MSEPIYEHILAQELGVTRESLKAFREEGHWDNVPGHGIRLSPEAAEKIRAALCAPVPPPTFDLVIQRLATNPRIVFAHHPHGGEPVKVALCVRQDARMRPGWVLPGCTWSETRGLWEAHFRAKKTTAAPAVAPEGQP